MAAATGPHPNQGPQGRVLKGMATKEKSVLLCRLGKKAHGGLPVAKGMGLIPGPEKPMADWMQGEPEWNNTCMSTVSRGHRTD